MPNEEREQAWQQNLKVFEDSHEDDRKARDYLAHYWAKFYVVGNVCGLCVNTGRLKLINGDERPCLCPGGRTIADNMTKGRRYG